MYRPQVRCHDLFLIIAQNEGIKSVRYKVIMTWPGLEFKLLTLLFCNHGTQIDESHGRTEKNSIPFSILYAMILCLIPNACNDST